MLGVTLYSKTSDTETLYLRLTDMLSTMLGDIKHQSLSYKAVASDHSYVHPKNYNEIYCGGSLIGKIGVAYPTVLKKIDKKASIVFAELDVKAIVDVENAGIKYTEASKFPSIDVDLTFVSDKYAPIKAAIEQVNSELIKNVGVYDVYSDESGKAITVRISFVHAERTLTKDEVMAVADKIIGILKDQGIALKN